MLTILSPSTLCVHFLIGICTWKIKLRWKFYFITTKKKLTRIPIKCYIGRNDNPSFSEGFKSFFCLLRIEPPSVGSEPLDKLSHRIWQSVGPSGPNKVSLCLRSANKHETLEYSIFETFHQLHRTTSLNLLNLYENSHLIHMIPIFSLLK